MKISIGMNLQTGPFGGGNQFGQALSEYLTDKGHQAVFDLKDPDIDIILLCEPRKNTTISAFNQKDILWYLIRKNRNALVVHRINECDERKGTSSVNRILLNANICADHTVFVSKWLMELFQHHGIKSQSYSYIRNGSNTKFFNDHGYSRWMENGPLKLVTHHWGGGWMKGFDIYQRFDDLLGDSEIAHQFEFTYIGNLPSNFSYKNSTYIPPQQGFELAKEIKRNHVYLTASINEPGSNHQNDGALCGLPLLYLNSGSLPEYCQGFGIEFEPENFEEKLFEMQKQYQKYVKIMKDYPYSAERMCKQYLELFDSMEQNRDEYLRARTWQNKPFWLLKNIMTG